MEFLLHPLTALESWLTDPPEVQSLNIQLKSLKRQRWNAIKIAFKTPKASRKNAWETVHELRAEEKEIHQKLHQLKHQRDDNHRLIKNEKEIYFLEEVNTFTGWLLFFYLMYYFIGHYVTTQGLPLKPILGIPFDMGHSALFKYLLAIAFIVHAGLSIKLNFFLRRYEADQNHYDRL